MPGNGTELRVPVRLDVLQDSVAQLQQVLNNLEPKTSAWKDLKKLIESMSRETETLSINLSKPFGSQKDFVAAEKSVGKIEAAFQRAQNTIASIHFSDIKLTTSQQEELDKLTDDLNKIKNEVTTFKTQLKENLKSSDLWADIEQIDGAAISHSFDQILKIVGNKVNSLQAEADKAQKAFNKINKGYDQEKIDITKKFFSNKDNLLSKETLGDDIYEQYFTKKGAFKSNAREQFIDWMKQNLALNESDITKLTGSTAKSLREALSKMLDKENILKKLEKTVTEHDAAEATKEDTNKKLQNAQKVLRELTASQQEVIDKENALEPNTRAAAEAIENFKTNVTSATQAEKQKVAVDSQLTASTDMVSQALRNANAEFLKAERITQTFNSIKSTIVNFMGFTQVLNLTKRAVKEALNHIQDLDSVMNKISIVTDMSTGDLWNQVDAYSKMAQTYGVSIKGAYEVSQIYYQQGLKTKDVLTLTNETLKLSKVSGLDYASTTDYMTTALRGFKMEMSEASKVVDVYSNLAAHTAVSQEELAIAMSKTASSMQSVGSTFEETSAMIGTMVAVTRESATNIGSALKSIAARYGEMKSNPSATQDIEGEALAYNKVDTALQSVGISMKTADGQFREFTDVIIELGEKWNQLESTQQRYIATQFAGNRQQSRFLALISNVDLLKSNISFAEDSEDTGTLQAIKALDSVESKLEQVKVAYQQFYTTMGVETMWKGALDGLKNYINYLNGLPKLFGKIPLGAIAVASNIVGILKLLGDQLITNIASAWKRGMEKASQETQKTGIDVAKEIGEQSDDVRAASEELGKIIGEGVQSGITQGMSQSTTTLINQAAEASAKVGKATASEQAAGEVPTTAKVQKDTSTSTAAKSSIETALSKNMFASDLTDMMKAQKVDFSNIEDSVTRFTQMFVSFAQTAQTAKTAFSNAGADAIAEYAQGILSNAGVAEEAAEVAGEKAAAGFKLNQWLDQQIGSLILTSKPEDLIASLNELPDQILEEARGPLLALGPDLSESIALGLLQSKGKVDDAAASVASSLVATLRSALNMHSPSPTIIAMFENGVGEAIALGLKASQEEIKSAASELGLTVSTELEEAFNHSKKINLSDYLEAGDAQQLAKTVAQKHLKNLDKQFAQAYKNEQKGMLENDSRQADFWKTIQAELNPQRDRTKSTIARMENISYEKIPVDYVVATHNLNASYLSDMASKWNGQIPSPSIAVRAMQDSLWSNFGNKNGAGLATLFMPRKYADPTLGHTNLYPGDAYTPMLDGEYETIEEARKFLDSFPLTDFDFGTELSGAIRDATHIPDLAYLRKILQNSTELPFGSVKDKMGKDTVKRLSPSQNDQYIKSEENILYSTLEYYLKKSGLENYNDLEVKRGAMSNGRGAFGKALYDTVDMMRQAESLGQAYDKTGEEDLLRKNLYKTFLEEAEIDVPTKFNDENASSLIEDMLRHAHFLEKKPGYDFAEAKSARDNVGYEELPSALVASTSTGIQGMLDGINTRLNAATSFFFDQYAKEGPLSHQAVGRYIINNVPGVAFNENGPLVEKEYNNGFDASRLKETFSQIMPEAEMRNALENNIINIIENTNLGQVLANTLAAGLSNIDFNAENATAALSGVMDTLARALRQSLSFEGLSDVGLDTARQIVAGMAIGLSSDVAQATTAAEGAGSAVIAALNAGAGVASPSIYAIQAGKFVMLGLEEGMSEEAEKAFRLAEETGQGMIFRLDKGLDSPNALRDILAQMNVKISEMEEGLEKERAIKVRDAIKEGGIEFLKKSVAENPTKTGKDGEVLLESLKYAMEHTFSSDTKTDSQSIIDQINARIEQIKAHYASNPNALISLAKSAIGRSDEELMGYIPPEWDETRKQVELNARKAIRDEFSVKELTPVSEQPQEIEATVSAINSQADAYKRLLEIRKELAAGGDKKALGEERKALADQWGIKTNQKNDWVDKKIKELEGVEAPKVALKVSRKAEKQAKKEQKVVQRQQVETIKVDSAEAEAEGQKAAETIVKAADGTISEETISAPKVDVDPAIKELQKLEAEYDKLNGDGAAKKIRANFSGEDADYAYKQFLKSALGKNTFNIPTAAQIHQANQNAQWQPSESAQKKSEAFIQADAAAKEQRFNDAKQKYRDLITAKREAGAIGGKQSAALLANMGELKTVEELHKAYEELDKIKETNFNDAEDEEALGLPDEEKVSGIMDKIKGIFENNSKVAGNWARAIGTGLSAVTSFIDTTTEGGEVAKNAVVGIGGAINFVGTLLSGTAGPVAIISAAITAITGIMGLINSMSLDAKVERAEKKSEELVTKAKQAKAEYKTLDEGVKKLDELNEKRYESAEATEEYQSAVDDLAEQFPQLIAGFDSAGNVIIDTTNAETLLAESRKASAQATYEAAQAELEAAKLKVKQAAKNSSSINVSTYGSMDGSEAQVQNELERFNFGYALAIALGKDEGKAAEFGEQIQLGDSTSNEYAKEIAEYYKNSGVKNSDYNFLLEGYDKNGEFSLSSVHDYLNSLDTLTETQKQFKKTFFDQTLIDDFNAAAEDYNELGETATVEERLEAFGKVRDAFNKAYENGAFIDEESLKAVQDSFGELGESLDTYESLVQNAQGMRKSVIGQWLQTQNNVGESYGYLEESAAAAALVTGQINKDWAAYEDERKKTFEVNKANYDIITKEDYITQMDEFWNRLNSDQKEQFNKMFSDSKYYSTADFADVFANVQGIDAIVEMLKGYYSNGIENIESRLHEGLARLLNRLDDEGNAENFQYDDLEEGFAREFAYLTATHKVTTGTEESYLNNVLGQYESLNKAGYAQRAETFGLEAIKLFKDINDAPADIQKQLWQLVEENSLNTYEGLQKIKDGIKGNEKWAKEVDTNVLDRLQNIIIPNINLEIQTATSNLLDTWEDTSKTLSSALSSGVSLKEADQLIQKAKSMGLDFDMSNFQLAGDKLVLIGKSFDEYYNALTESTATAAAEWQTRINRGSQILAGAGSGNIWRYTETDRALLDSLGFDITNNEYYKNGALTTEGIKALQEAIDKNQDDLNNYNLAAKVAAQQLLRSHEFSQGIYKINDTVQSVKDLRQIVSNGVQLSKDQIEERAIKTSVNSVYSSLMSDLLSKGIENINLDDYEGLIQGDRIELDKLKATGDSTGLIYHIYDLAGNSLEELDQALAQNTQKTTSRYSTAIKEILNYKSDKYLSEATRSLNISVEEIEARSEDAIVQAAAFLKILAAQIGKAGYTLSEYNATAKSVLEQALFNNGGRERAVLEFASNNIDANSLETLANALGIKINDLVDVTTGEVQDFLANDLAFNPASGTYEIQRSFDELLDALSKKFGTVIAKGSKEYVAALKSFNENAITKEHEVDKAITEELKNVASAKVGDKINLAQTYSTLFSNLDEISEQALAEKFASLNASFSNGILTLESGANIQGIIQLIVDQAKSAGQMIPEEIAELKDAIVETLKSITNLINNGIEGSLSNVDKLQLENWAAQYDIVDLQFSQTADGFKLANDSAIELYNTVRDLDSIQGQIVFEKLKDNLIATDDNFKSISAAAAHIVELEEQIENEPDFEWSKELIATEKAYNQSLRTGEKAKIAIFESLNGNTDMYNRPWIENADGSHSTILGTEFLGEALGNQTVHIAMTPIPEWATSEQDYLSLEQLESYYDELMKEHPMSIDALLELDAKGVEMDGKLLKNMLIDVKDASKVTEDEFKEEMNQLHIWSDNWERIRQQKEMPDNYERVKALEEELALAREIEATRATTEDASFSFMSNKIPGGQNNPLNYLGDWSKAFSVMQEAGKDKNMIDYTDFYNIITEMGNLAEKSGEIRLSATQVLNNAEDAAALIEQGANALSIAADGSIKVDLGKLGIDFSTGANDLKASVGEGIKEIADSQIKMLDSMIQLLETIVAMEELGNIDVEGNGIDLSEMFQMNGDNFILDENNLVQWTDGMHKAAEKILASADELGPDSDLYKGLENVKVNGTSLRKIFEQARDNISVDADTAKAYHAAISAFYAAMQSGDYDLDSIYESMKNILAGSGFEGEIKVGDMHLVFNQGMVFEKDEKGNIVYNGKTYSGDNALEDAKNAMRNDQVTAALAAFGGVQNEETGETTLTATTMNGGKIEITSSYNVETGKFEAIFSDGGFVSSDTAEGLAAAIQHYSYMQKMTLAEAETTTTSSDELTYSITKKGQVTVDWKVDVKTGEVETINPGSTTEEIGKALSDQMTASQGYTMPVKADTTDADTKISETDTALTNLANGTYSPTISVDNTGALNAISAVETKLTELNGKVVNTTVNTKTYNQVITSDENGAFGATGNFGLAKAKGTLMGELGPELVVQGSRYFVAGQGGPEFVDLQKDAIVFNHLQTEQLLKKGMSTSRGQAVTNERNAVAFAHGNINGGPAMASAKAALAALRQLRDQWKAIANMSAQDFAGLGGSGGGGGGGGDNAAERKAFIKDLEIWYNWLQRIAQLEVEINREEKKRSVYSSSLLRSGEENAKSNLESLKLLREQAVVHQALADTQQEYLDKLIKQKNTDNRGFDKLYGFKEDGQMYYKDNAFAKFAEMVGRDSGTGAANYTAEEQYNALVSMGFESQMEYDSSGNKIDKSQDDWYVSAVQAFWDKIDADKAEVQSLKDSVDEHMDAVLENQAEANEIMREIEDTQRTVEDDVLQAITDLRQYAIDELQKERDALEKSTTKVIDGLSDQLNKEKDMYTQQESADELLQMQRREAILRSGGGSQAEIASLQDQIALKQRDMYFEAQQKQIDALQEAANNELERLDAQIALMTESLAYEKENGLLWMEVRDIMDMAPENIAAFIMQNTQEFWGQSPLQNEQTYRDVLYNCDEWAAYKKEFSNGKSLKDVAESFTNYAIKQDAKIERALADSKEYTDVQFNKVRAEISALPSSSGSGGSGSGSGSNGGAGNNGGKSGPSHWKVNGIQPSGSPANLGPYSSKEAAERMLTQASHNGWTNLSISSYDRGGIIDKDKFALVHAKESVLTADQTNTLRNDILGNKPTSLMNMLLDFKNAYNGLGSAASTVTNNSSGVTIEQAIVEMHVSKIDNDYDAQRAGEQALEKMVQIARKSYGQNRVGR